MKYFNFLLLCMFLLMVSGCNSINEINSENTSSSTASFEVDNEESSIAEYQKLVENFEEISPIEISNKIDNGDEFFLFIGRKTCPYCRMFAPKLKKAIDHTNIQIKYLNVENEQKNLENFAEKYDIQYVPELRYFDGSDYTSKIENLDSENITVDEILEFLESPKDSSI